MTRSDVGLTTASAAEHQWPFLGREQERAVIDIARAEPSCTGVLIAAASGVGRSRLARETVLEADRQGELTYWAQATVSSATVPLGAFAALIPDDVRSEDPLELIRRSTERVTARAAGRRVCLGIDDAQLLDPASAALVLHLATAAGVFVVATLSLGVTVPDAIESLWKDAGARRMDLRALSDEAIEELVEAVLRGPVEQSALRRVIDASGGNVMYVRELIVGALEEGRLVFDNGLWRLRRRGVSPSLAALVKRRIGILAEEERAALELLALGEPLRVGEMTCLSQLSVLEALEARAMLTVERGPADSIVRLGQPLYGEVLRAELPVLRARSLRLKLAETIGARSPLAPDDILRVAHFLQEAGQAVPRKYLLEAGHAAEAAGDPDLGAQLAELALAAGLGLPAALVLSRAHVMRKRFAEAEVVLAAAEHEAPGHPLALSFVAQRMHVLYWGLNQVEDARAFLQRAARWSEDPSWRRRLDPWALVLSGFVDSVEDYREDGGSRETPHLEAQARRQLDLAHGFRLMASGRVKEADALVRRIRPTVPLAGNDDTYALGLASVVGLEGGEDWADLADYAVRLVRDGVRVNDHQSAGLGAFILAGLGMAAGRYRDARRWIAEADSHFEVQDAFGTVFSLRALEVGLCFFTGELAAARSSLATVRAMAGQSGPPPTQAGYLARAEGWGARALSDAAGAEIFLSAAAGADQPNLASRLLHEGLRAGGNPKRIAAEQSQLAKRCDARLVTVYAAYAAARAEHDGSALLVVADEMAIIGAEAYGMEAALDSARQFLAEGREDSARRAAVRARELYFPDQDAEFPIIDGLDAMATELTRRELQISSLVARGMSNQEIADQLFLSVRTVETYVYRAMQKRGVTSRQEL